MRQPKRSQTLRPFLPLQQERMFGLEFPADTKPFLQPLSSKPMRSTSGFQDSARSAPRFTQGFGVHNNDRKGLSVGMQAARVSGSRNCRAVYAK